MTWQEQFIEKVNTDDKGYIRFSDRQYLKHGDVINFTPIEFKNRFSITIRSFNILKTKFSKGDIK